MYVKRLLILVALVAGAVGLPAALAAASPDDRPYPRAAAAIPEGVSGPDDRSLSRSAVDEGPASISPDDRPFGRYALEPVDTPAPVHIADEPQGFDWGDALIGAAAAAIAAALLIGATRALGGRRGPPARPTMGSV